MRWFWSFIALLCLLTAGLYASRVHDERRQLQDAGPEPAPHAAATTTREHAHSASASSTASSPDFVPDHTPDPTAASAQPPVTSSEQAETPDPEPVTSDRSPTEAAIQPPTQPSATDAVADTPSSGASGFDPAGLIASMRALRDRVADDSAPLDASDAHGAQADGAQRSVSGGESVQARTEHANDAPVSPAGNPRPDPGAEPQLGSPAELHAEVEPEEQSEKQPEEQPEEQAGDQALARVDERAEDQGVERIGVRADADDGAARAPGASSYERGEDGSFRIIDANIWVHGAGTEESPFVLSWDVLKSVERSYDPRNGKETLPDWLELLEGKRVVIEGNTLVPVVASSTRELLMMQNPWDGCCIGVPPTPYDAVEITLNHEVDFGNSAVGYGSVRGTFYTDPYVVDGWVLGLYIIEDGEYRSGEGVAFPEF